MPALHLPNKFWLLNSRSLIGEGGGVGARGSRRSCGRASKRPGSRGGAPPGEGWAAGAPWALQGTYRGRLTFLQACWGGLGKAEVQRDLQEDARGWGLPSCY